MGTYRTEWTCCGDVTETDSWEPTECPFCSASKPVAKQAADWVTLTDEEMAELFESYGHKTSALLVAHEAKLREKNGGQA